MRRVLAVLLLLALPAAAEELVTRSYPTGLLAPSAAAATARALVTPAGTVVADEAGKRLVVIDTAAGHARVAAALRAVTDNARNVRLRVTTTWDSSTQGMGVGATARRREVRTGAFAGSSSGQGTTTQEIVTLSGSTAAVKLARSYPYTEWLVSWGASRRLWAAGTAFREIGTSLAVEPQVLGSGQILVKVTPRVELVGLDGRRSDNDIAELQTEVIVRPGEDVDLGGLPRADAEFRERFLVGIDDAGRTSRVQMRLRADVLQ